MYDIELWKGLDGQWYWHIVSRKNKQVIATSEGYKRKSSAFRIAQKVSLNLAEAKFIWEG